MGDVIKRYKREAHFESGKHISEQTLNVYFDEDAESPREWSNISHMVCFHGRYNLGDNHDYKSGDFSSWDDLEERLIEDEGAYIIRPLSLYDHSGITIFIGEPNDRWDSGRVGFVYVTKETIEHEYGSITPEIEKLVEEVIESEVKLYDQYLQGDVYGYTIEDADGEEIDSCWGFYAISDILGDTGFTEEDGAVEIYSSY